MLRLNDADVKLGVLTINQSTNIQNNLTVSSSNALSNPVAINSCTTSGGGSALDALPKAFVASMKTLFDILDDSQTGFVKFSDIEKGWQDDDSKGLPKGVIDSLRKVTPLSGLLTFERFCAGLKLCLLRNQNGAIEQEQLKLKTNGLAGVNTLKIKSTIKSQRPPSAPALDINALTNDQWSTTVTTTPLHAHSISSAHRALSLPQLSPDSEGELVASANIYNSPPPPPKPPRASAAAAAAVNVANKAKTATNAISLAPLDKAGIRHALRDWQMGILRNEIDTMAMDPLKSTNYLQQCGYRGSADGGSSSATDADTNIPLKKIATKRREPRRHTLQNGIDYNMLKRLKHFEEEREVLLLGLEAVNKARDWYMQQLHSIQDKIKYLARMGSSNVEPWSELQQERVNFQRARVLEVNRSLSALADCWERGGLPLHFNLAIRTPQKSLLNRFHSSHSFNSTLGERLRQQNRLLTSEVHLKTERISMLEREKQTLLSELFELKQRSGALTRHVSSRDPHHNILSQSSGCSTSSGGLGDVDVVY